MSAPTPPLITKAFGIDADDPDFINLIPVTTADPGRASQSLAFPPRTMQPVIAGGTPPFGQDINGFLYMLSSHTVAQQAGAPYYYSADVVAAIGGYVLGTLLGMSDGSGFWINRTPNNTTNPDTGGAGWVPLYSYGPATVPNLVGGAPVTLTAAQAKKKLIILQGTLVANLQIVVPNVYQDWLIVNQTTGNFTTTVKTAGGTGVVIPQGGNAAPVGVYGDTVNVYPTVAPLTGFSISQGPDPSTIAQRLNTGDLIARNFVMTATSGAPPNVSGVFFEQNGDGYIRKTTVANLAAYFALSQFAGQVTDGQVPFSAVLQWAAALFSSPVFTGAPTAPTAPVGTNTTRLATTQFVMTQALGNGQTWSNPSRALNTNYTNTTGRAIQLAIGVNIPSGAGANVVIDGVQVAANSAGGGATERLDSSPVVPPGSIYQVGGSGSAAIETWAELS